MKLIDSPEVRRGYLRCCFSKQSVHAFLKYFNLLLSNLNKIKKIPDSSVAPKQQNYFASHFTNISVNEEIEKVSSDIKT